MRAPRALTPHRAALVGLTLITLLAFAWRLDRAASEGLYFDEGTSIRIAGQILDGSTPAPRHGGDHPVLGVYLLALSGWVFGRDDVGFRLLNVLAGSLTVPLLAFAVARSASRGEALVAALLLAVNPFHVGLSAFAIEVPFQILFVTLALAFAADLPAGGRPALIGCAAALGLGFMCSESTALVLLGWLVAVALDRGRTAGLHWRDWAIAFAVGLAIVAQDIHYNLTARGADFHYVNYLDHLLRLGQPAVSLHGIGFFLRDALELLEGRLPDWLWVDPRSEYLGPGIALGGFLLVGWLAAMRRGGDPSRGLWSWPVHAFVLITTFTAAVVDSPMLDSATWTWPQPIVPLASALAARFAFTTRWAPWAVLLAVVALWLLFPPRGLPRWL